MTAMLVGSTAWLGSVLFEDQWDTEPLDWIRFGSSWILWFSFRAQAASRKFDNVGLELARCLGFYFFWADGEYKRIFASVGLIFYRACLDTRFRWSDIIFSVPLRFSAC